MSVVVYKVVGAGFEVELATAQGAEAACRRAMWALIAGGHLEPSGTPAEMLAQFEATPVGKWTEVSA